MVSAAIQTAHLEIHFPLEKYVVNLPVLTTCRI